MQLDLPDDILRQAEANTQDVLLAAAMQLYSDNRIDHAAACRLAGVSDSRFSTELARHGISVQLAPPNASDRRAG